MIIERARQAMVWVAGGALVAAAAINLLAVIGRHTGMPFKGSIELVQVAVLISGSLALIASTVARNHARVHLVLDRLGERPRFVAEHVCTALAILFYLAFLTGAVWLAVDLWDSQEVSEVVGVPWRGLRLFLNASVLVILILLVRQLCERRR